MDNPIVTPTPLSITQALLSVTPAKAGVSGGNTSGPNHEIPAFAGMTGVWASMTGVFA